MKRLLSFLAVAVLFVLGASSAKAQNGAFAPYVDAGISASGNPGGNGSSVISTTNPNYRIGGGIESSTKHLLLDINTQFDSGNLSGFRGVIKNTGGYTVTLTGSAYYKLGGFLLGGGGLYSNQILSGEGISVNYNQVRPFVGTGYQFKRDRLIVDYVLPGKEQIAGFTGVNDRTVLLTNEIFLGQSGLRKHLRFTQTFGVSSNNTNFLTPGGLRTDTYTAGAGIKFVL